MKHYNDVTAKLDQSVKILVTYPFDSVRALTELNLLTYVAKLEDFSATFTAYLTERIKFGIRKLCDRVKDLFELFHFFECVTIKKS